MPRILPADCLPPSSWIGLRNQFSLLTETNLLQLILMTTHRDFPIHFENPLKFLFLMPSMPFDLLDLRYVLRIKKNPDVHAFSIRLFEFVFLHSAQTDMSLNLHNYFSLKFSMTCVTFFQSN